MSEMPWFPFYVDDFLGSQKVQRMTMEEIGVYLMLLCQQYQEGAIEWPCERIANALRGHERSIEYVLAECFEQTSEGWKNARLSRIQADQQEKSDKARMAAKARWDKGSGGTDATAKRTHVRPQSERNANQSQNQNQKKQTYVYTDAFEEVWSTHARGSKRKAFEAYRKAVPCKIPHEQLTQHLRAYVATFGRDFEGAHLFRWINEERWEEQKVRNGNGKAHDDDFVTRELARRQKLLEQEGAA